MTKKEYSVYVWCKTKSKFLPLPSRLKTFEQALKYFKNHKEQCSWCHPSYDYERYEIRFRTVTYSEWKVV